MNFDWKFYINYYKDLPENGIINEELAKLHWNNHGKSEGRICNKYQIKNYDYKKNIAILFSGQMRKNSLKSYDFNDNTIINSISLNFINDEFKNKYNYDIFISTDNANIEKIIEYFGKEHILKIYI